MTRKLETVESACSICGNRDSAELVGRGHDFEYRTSPDEHFMYRCRACTSYFLHPRPARSELSTIYPDSYHAYEFNAEEFGISHRARRAIERRRLMDWCSRVPGGGEIIDIGSGNGFHLSILKEFGDPSWALSAVEPDPKSTAALEQLGVTAHTGFLEDLRLEPDRFDFAIMIMVVEHVDDPLGVLREVRRILKPGGRLGVVTDNIDSLDARFGRDRHWGGYHFPRHFNLYNKASLSQLAEKAGFRVEEMTTMVSPVNWTYTIHNRLEEQGSRLAGRFTLKSPLSLALFTGIDILARAFDHAGLLRCVLRRADG